jgi:hypothetical protein
MDALEEIRAIKQLLDKGEITNEEFQFRKRKILQNTAFEDKNVTPEVVENKQKSEAHTIPVDDKKFQITQEPNPSKGVNAVTPATPVAEKPINALKVYEAGKRIKSSVIFTILGAFCSFSSVMITILAFGDIMASASRGSGLPENSGMRVAAGFAGFAVLFWIISVAQLYDAGQSLKNSAK